MVNKRPYWLFYDYRGKNIKPIVKNENKENNYPIANRIDNGNYISERSYEIYSSSMVGSRSGEI